jgi:predicted Zn-dependent protease
MTAVRSLSAALLAAVLAAGLALPLAGCTVNPATGEQSFTAFMSPEQEVQVGRQEHPKILRQHGGAYVDRNLSAYVEGIGQRLAAVSELPHLRFTFTVLNDDLVNAFALPGGYVYITRGLLALASNEAEAAGVLAHEIGHVVARHSAQRYSQTVAANLGLTILGVASGNQSLTDMAGLGANLYLRAYSREHELEADMLGVRYMARAGYDPAAMVSFFRKMEGNDALQAAIAGKAQDGGFDLMATHPRTADRIEQAIRLASVAVPPAARLGEDDFLRRIDGLAYGDDPKEGVVRGREFIHPDLRLRFEVPPGFRIFNGRKAVVAKGPQGTQIGFDLGRDDRSVGSMVAYLSRVWGADLRLAEVERIDVNGLDGATGVARVQTSQGPRDLRLVVARLDGLGLGRFIFMTPPHLTRALELDLRRVTYSLRRLSPSEAAAVRPLRVRVVTVGPRDNLEGFVALMPFADFKAERFAVLNGLRLGERPRPGVRVKIVE